MKYEFEINEIITKNVESKMITVFFYIFHSSAKLLICQNRIPFQFVHWRLLFDSTSHVTGFIIEQINSFLSLFMEFLTSKTPSNKKTFIKAVRTKIMNNSDVQHTRPQTFDSFFIAFMFMYEAYFYHNTVWDRTADSSEIKIYVRLTATDNSH